MAHELVPYTLLLLTVLTVRHFIRKNDELPLLLVILNLLVEGRIFALKNDYAEWVSFDYGIGFEFDMELAYTVSGLICLGTLTMVSTYLFFYKDKKKVKRDNEKLFVQFIKKNKTKIIIGFVFFFLFQLGFGSALSKGYSFLLTLATSSFIVLLFLLVYYVPISYIEKIIFGTLLVVLALGTYGGALRFQFLGWLIPIALLLTRNLSPLRKSYLFGASAFFVLVLFSIAGVIRSRSFSLNNDFSTLYNQAIERILAFEDVNFVDGFMMLHQVYPEHLDHHYGADHLGILARPIPRSWWPGKPRGGWHQKFADKYELEHEFSTGISPTIFGVFYGEGGREAIVIFSVLWALMFLKIVNAAGYYERGLEYIIKGILIAALIPVYRSGDLPGDIAIVGMSYWPMFVFIYRYNKYIKAHASEVTDSDKTLPEAEFNGSNEKGLPDHHFNNPFVIKEKQS